MKVQCPECEARFKLPDDQVRSGMKVRCSRCKHVFRLGSPTGRAPKLDVSEATIGPVSSAEVGAAFGSLDEMFSGFDPTGAPAPNEPAPATPAARPTFGADDPFSMDDPFEATRGPFDIPGYGDEDDDDLSLRGHRTDRDGQLDDMIGGLLGQGAEADASVPRSEDARTSALPKPALGSLDAMFEGTDPPPPGMSDPGGLAVNDGLSAEPQEAGPSLATFLAKTPQEKVQPPMTLGRIGLLPRGVKRPKSESEREGPAGARSAPPPAAAEDAFEIEGNAPPGPAPPKEEMLGNLDRANQFAMDMGVDEAPGGGQFFDPESGGVPETSPASPVSPAKVVPRSKVTSGRRSPPGTGGAVIAAGPAVSNLVVDANRSVPQSIANVLLVALLVGAGFLAFVAVEHDGILDIYQLGDMTASAFGRGEYHPRGSKPEEPAAKIDESVKVEDLEQLHFPNSEGRDLFVVEGKVVNRGDKTLRDVFVGGSVYNSRGDLIGSVTAPAGRTMTEEELLGVVDRKSLAAVSKTIAADTRDLRLGPKQAFNFSVVFPSLPGGVGQRRTFKVAVDAYLNADAAEAPAAADD